MRHGICRSAVERSCELSNRGYALIPGVGIRLTIAPICYDTRDKKATVIGLYLKIIKIEVSSSILLVQFQKNSCEPSSKPLPVPSFTRNPT